jgi:hypothetical protein
MKGEQTKNTAALTMAASATRRIASPGETARRAALHASGIARKIE